MGNTPSSPRRRRHSSSKRGHHQSSSSSPPRSNHDQHGDSSSSTPGEDQHIVKSTLRRIWMISGASIGVIAIVALLLYKDYLLLFVLGFLSCWTLFIVNEMFGSVVNATRSMYQYNFVSKSSSNNIQHKQSLNIGGVSVEEIIDDRTNHHSKHSNHAHSVGDRHERKLLDRPDDSHTENKHQSAALVIQPHRKYQSRKEITQEDDSVDFELDISKSRSNEHQQQPSPPSERDFSSSKHRSDSKRRHSNSAAYMRDRTNGDRSGRHTTSGSSLFPFLQDLEDPYYKNLFGDAINQMKHHLNNR